MDIRCTTCGEPWDTDTLHDVISEEYDPAIYTTDGKHDQAKYEPLFNAVREQFVRLGCELFGTRHGEVNQDAAEVAGIAMDMMGDDIDGVASMLEDAESMGLFD